MEYIVIQYYDKDVFEKLVKERLDNSWELHGGVSISWSINGLLYAQAMIKKVTNI